MRREQAGRNMARADVYWAGDAEAQYRNWPKHPASGKG